MSPTIKEIAGEKFVLWGASWSLYTAKVRPYLIKKGIDYVEICPSHPHYHGTHPAHGWLHYSPCFGNSGWARSSPTRLEIMEFLEPNFPDPPMLPEDKSLAALTYLIHSFGSEGLTKSSMYLRWNTSYANRLFARNEFQRTLATPEHS